MRGRSIGGYLIVLFFAVLALGKVKTNQNKRTRKKDKDGQNAHPPINNPIALTSDLSPPTPQSEEAKRKRKEESYWFWSKIGASVGGFSAVGAAIFAYAAFVESKSQADTAQQALINADRPWIKIDAVKIEKVEVQADQVLFWVNFTVKNVGHSPAQKVAVFPKILLPTFEPWTFKEVQTLCGDIRDHSNLVVGSAIFPDDAFSQTINFGRPMKDIDAVRLVEEKRLYDGWKQGFGASEAEVTVKSTAWMRVFTQFSLIGCVSYRFSSNDSVHQTSLTYELARDPSHPDVEGDHVSFEINTKKLGTISGSELRLTPSMIGTFAN